MSVLQFNGFSAVYIAIVERWSKDVYAHNTESEGNCDELGRLRQLSRSKKYFLATCG